MIAQAAPDLAARVERLRERIDGAARPAGRDPDEVTVVAVSKTHPPVAVEAVLRAGVRDIGESRVAELVAKQPHVAHARWHFVGRLQSRKVRDLVGRVALIHSVDRRSLVDEVSSRATERQRVLIQVNVGDDPRKGGCDLHEALDLVAYARRRPQVLVEGFMTVPPMPAEGEDPNEAAAPHFARLRALRDDAVSRWPEVTELSMGMTADLDAAVAEGATIVRVGTALFGPRGDSPWRP